MTAAPALRPLSCPSCGAAVPLTQGRTSRCLYCKTETPIPEGYGALQRAALSFASDRKLAEQLYGRIGKPPGRFTRLLARGAEGSVKIGSAVGLTLIQIALAHPLIGLGLVLAAAYALGFPVALLMRGVWWMTGAPSPGPLPAMVVLPLTAVIAIFGLGVPAALFEKERAVSSVRRDIHASLAAALPEREGGPARCRNCGGALDVPRGALGVPCAYCKADNLVALPADWVTQVRSKEFHHFLRIDSALEAFRRASEETTERIWKLGLALVLVFPLVIFLAWLLMKAGISF